MPITRSSEGDGRDVVTTVQVHLKPRLKSDFAELGLGLRAKTRGFLLEHVTWTVLQCRICTEASGHECTNLSLLTCLL